MKKCKHCDAPLDDDSQFCANCGKKVKPQGKTCPLCGTEAEDDSAFCTKCGTRLDVQEVPFMNSPQVVYPTTFFQEEEVIVNELEEEDSQNWQILIGGIAVVVLLSISWYGYTLFYRYTHVDIHELLENLQLPKEYYHSAKEIVNKENFNLKTYQEVWENAYALRGWIVYNQKYGNEIRFNNKTFKSDDESLEDYYWTIGHIWDCWNSTPAEATYDEGWYDETWTYTFYYTSNKSKGMQFVVSHDCDEKGNLKFQSVDGEYEANFKQVHL